MHFSKAHLQLLLSTLLWSGSVLFVKVSVQNGPPIHMAALRFTLAALIMLPAILATGWPREVTRADWRDIFTLGFLGIFLYNICFFYALFYTSAAEGALIMAAAPAAHFIIAFVAEGERLTPLRALGIALSVAGIALVVLGGSGAPPAQAPNRLLGDGLMLIGMFLWALNSLYGKRLGRRLSVAATTGLPVAVASAIYLVVTLPTGLIATVSSLPLPVWGAIGYLVVASTIIGRQLWFAGLKGVDVTQAGVFFNIMPVWSTALATLFLGESLQILQLAGGALVLAGVFLTTARTA